MIFKGFWGEFDKPIVGMAPMDGVTDAAFRFIVNKYSEPDVTFTEFTNVEGLARGASNLLMAFLYSQNERPIVAQIFGTEVESFYKATVMLASLGFDGVDINMGCPSNNVTRHGCGASLIQTPDLAREIIRACKKGARDWADGVSLEEAGVHEDVIAEIGRMRERVGFDGERRLIPISVKTRTGYSEVVAEEWVKILLEELPAAICMHGRTLKQGYKGDADWDVLRGVSEIVRSSGTGVLFLGNGDAQSMDDAYEKIERFGVDGVLVGRAVFGNPWFFGGDCGGGTGLRDRFRVCLEHCQYLERELPELAFHTVRKHMAWYMKGFEGAKGVRMKMMHAQNAREVEEILEGI